MLLQALERDGSVIRATEAPVGKALPTRLTPRGRRALAKATTAVRGVEVRMLSGLSDEERAAASILLRRMIASLRLERGDAAGG